MQKDTWVIKSLVPLLPSFRFFVCEEIMQVGAVVTFDTVHQALISHTGEHASECIIVFRL